VLESRERKAKLEPLEDSGVYKEEGFLRARVVNTHGLTLPARQNLHVYVKFPLEYAELLARLAFLVLINVLKGVYLRSLSQKAIWSPGIECFVIDGKWRVWCSFGSGHLKRGN